MVSETRRLPDNVHEVKPARPTTPSNLFSLLKYSWRSLDEWRTKKAALSNLRDSLGMNRDPDTPNIKILGELLGEERYPSVSIFNVKALRKDSLPIIESLIKTCYPNSKIKLFDKLQKDMTSEELRALPLTGYCSNVFLSKDFCISVVASECLRLISGKTQRLLDLPDMDRCWQSYEV